MCVYQKINHFPGMYQICRKGDLARSLSRMARKWPDEYCFAPQTWVSKWSGCRVRVEATSGDAG